LTSPISPSQSMSSNNVLIWFISYHTILTQHMPTIYVFTKAHSMLAKEFSATYHTVLQALRMKWHKGYRCIGTIGAWTQMLIYQSIKNKKAWFKVALRRYLNTCSFYLVYKIFIVFCSALILYTLHALYILHVYDFFHILLSFWQTMDPWNKWMNEWINKQTNKNVINICKQHILGFCDDSVLHSMH